MITDVYKRSMTAGNIPSYILLNKAPPSQLKKHGTILDPFIALSNTKN